MASAHAARWLSSSIRTRSTCTQVWVTFFEVSRFLLGFTAEG